MSDQNQYAPNYAAVPGDIIEEHREAAAMTQAELGKRLGLSHKHVNRMIAGEEPITPETALKLESVFGLPAHVWLGLEARYSEFQARAADNKTLESETVWLKDIPYKSMAKLKWIALTKDKSTQVRILREFYQVGSLNSLPEVWSKLNAAYRKAPAFASQEWALVAWLTEGERRANAMQCQSYDASALRIALPEIKAMSRLPDTDFVELLTKRCASLGIALVFVPTPDGARVCGATRWLTSDKVLVQLSLRYKTDDQLWFTLFHELGHVLLHGKTGEYIDFEKTGNKNEMEKQADTFAVDSLVNQKALQVFATSGQLNAIRIEDFAAQQGVAPGIVLGQLQHMCLIPYATKLNSLKARFKWAHEQNAA